MCETGQAQVLQAKLGDHPVTTRSIYPHRVRLIDDQVCVARRENLVHSIDHRAERCNGSIHTIHALDRNKHATPTLLERYRFGAEGPKRRTERAQIVMRERPAETRCDTRCARSVVDRSVDGCVVEKRVARLRYACEEACVGVEARVEEEGCGRAERTREGGLARWMGVVVDEEPQAA